MARLLICILTFIFLATFLLGGAVFAQNKDAGLTFDPAESDENLGSVNEVQLGNERPVTIASNIVDAVLGLLGLIFLVLIIYGGFLWMSAAGNEEQVTKAKKILKSAVIGVVIVLSSYGIAHFIIGRIVMGTWTF